MPILRLFFAMALVLILVLPALAKDNESAKLLKIVALSRHGVRAPTQSDRVLHSWTLKTWPVWPVKKGDLTPRGARLVTAMWQDMRAALNQQGILPENMCPAPDTVYIRADSDERTRATAWALIQGLAPNCSIGYAAIPEKVDPLFHPVKAGIYKYNPAAVARDVLAMTDGGLRNLQEELAGPVQLTSEIIGSPSEAICERFAMTPECSLNDLPSAISVRSDGSSVHILGALSITSSLAEIFLLEYAEWPDATPGWGQVDGKVLNELLPAHAKVFDVVNRAPLVAWAQGGALLKEIGDALMGRHYDKRANDAKFVVFVGHDTNIANIGALMGIEWEAEGYPRDGIPPAGVMFFELWDNNGEKEIKIKFYAQSPEALRAPFYDEKNSGGEQYSHAPVPGKVATAPKFDSATYSEKEFERRWNAAVDGAPMAPPQLPETFYTMPAASE